MNFGANISWNKKEMVRALIEERIPRRRPTNREEIPACIKWNQYARWIEKSDDYQTIQQYVDAQTAFDTPDEWFKHLVQQHKEDSKRGRVRQWYADGNLEEDRTDRQAQGGSRKKGGRVGWPSTKTIK
ncbi:hypothetical protein SBP1_gp010 [Vibrio virus vB_VspP_SBP1]|uniref:Uncharacterized protein n=1 Tax=Vibrio virus vB_VspP_SBP1 TaxID=2500581 RepID=A0A3T0IIF2_9CAUD|nr:hypothetical protein KNU36_gp010 [Vibrio virus vB_VspP_SBP1]AZU99602.1 hypothetical protein SBP1_gp010 [Vibrio virus vB_VspP_SBP1]